MTMSAKVRVGLLGGFTVSLGGRPVPDSAWRLRKAKDLLKLLALAPGRRLHREQVMEHLWPDLEPAAATNNLHQAVHVARTTLQAGRASRVLDLSAGVLSLPADRLFTVDVDEYVELAQRARSAQDRSLYQAARELYRGPLLPEDRYEDWIEPERERLHQDHQRLLLELARLDEVAGDFAGAIQVLQEALADDPTDEAAHQQLMRAYVRSGDRRRALRQFETLRAVLKREVGAEPSAESARLHEQILTGALGPVSHGHTDAMTTARAPVKDRMLARTHNLPVQLSSLVGRQLEINELRRMIGDGRMVSLVGPGGSGKTRLAIEVGSASLPDFQGGVWLTELAALTDASLVTQAVADVLDVREQPNSLLHDLVAKQIADRRMLLILDNCEHLVEAVAMVAHSLLTSCPRLVVFATSRQPLHVPGETVFRLSGLTMANPSAGLDPEHLAGFESTRLFVERAQAAKLGFSLNDRNANAVARICHDLDGLPLAIELAASRVAALPVEVIAERLGDRFQLLAGGDRTALSRQQTLRATLDWSYNLLGDDERRVLQALSVFAGGCGIDAAEAICGRPGLPTSVVVLLGQLVDKSLVALGDDVSEPRFRLLETVREYALERLAESNDRDEVESRHANWCAELVEQAVVMLPRPERNPWMDRLEAEHDNLRAAIDRSLSANPALALRIAASLWDFWLWRGFLTEGRRRLERVLAAWHERTLARARALLGAATLSTRSGDFQAARRFAGESLEICRDLGDSKASCRALHVLAFAAWSGDELDEARRLLTQSHDTAVAVGWAPGEAAAMHALGVVCWYENDERRATELLDRSLAMFDSLGDHGDPAPPMLDMGEILVPQHQTATVRMVFEETFVLFQDVPCPTAAGQVLANRGMIARSAGNVGEARHFFESSLERFHSIGDERAIGQALARLGNLATSHGDYARAQDLLEESLALRRRIGDYRGEMLTTAALGNLAAAEGDVPRAHRLLQESASSFQRRGDLWGYAAALSNLANLALVQGQFDDAKRLLEASLASARRIGRRRWIGWLLVQLAALTRAAGDNAKAGELETSALDTLRGIGDRRGIQYLSGLERARQRRHAKVGPADRVRR